jgi:hypothetical protein
MKNKLFNSPLKELPRFKGIQKIYRFENGYGASVVRSKLEGIEGYGTYTDNENEWELAVIKFNGDAFNDFKICYDTKITDDVIGHLLEDEVEDILKRIKKLK